MSAYAIVYIEKTGFCRACVVMAPSATAAISEFEECFPREDGYSYRGIYCIDKRIDCEVILRETSD